MTRYNKGDTVKVLGCTEEVDWLSYVSADYDPEENMDMYIGKTMEIVDVDSYDEEQNWVSYKLDGCRFWWVEQWLAAIDPSQLPGQMSIEDFGLVVE